MCKASELRRNISHLLPLPVVLSWLLELGSVPTPSCVLALRLERKIWECCGQEGIRVGMGSHGQRLQVVVVFWLPVSSS